MVTTSVGLFDSFSEVMRAVDILLGCGFSRDELSIVTGERHTSEVCDDAGGRHKTGAGRGLVLSAERDAGFLRAQVRCLQGIGWVVVAGPLIDVLGTVVA